MTELEPLKFSIDNRSTVTDWWHIKQAVAAVQAQVALHYIPAWGAPSRKFYKLVFIDEDPSTPGALGYHDFEGDVPVAYILVKTTQDAGVAMSSVLSHEVLEMLADPTTTLVVMVDTSGDGSGRRGSLYMAEICDAVEQDSYTINGGVEVSNFVFPAWFDLDNKVGPFDHQHRLNAALQLLPGGSYIATLDFRSVGWQSKEARKGTVRRLLAAFGSRIR